jgi:transcriptional regulator with XRE-family HTH domain
VNRGITQKKLSEMSGLNIRTIQRVESGEMNILITTAIRLITAIGCPPDEIPPPAEMLSKNKPQQLPAVTDGTVSPADSDRLHEICL